jgi:hypothetical protein
MPVSESELSRHSILARIANPSRPVPFDFVDCVAELGREVRPEGKQAQVNLWMRRQFPQRPVEVAVIGPRSGHDPDAALVRGEIAHS